MQHDAPGSERLRRPEPPDHSPREHVPEAPAVERVASAVGNRGFTQMISRMGDGEGILPSGVVHPDVGPEREGSSQGSESEGKKPLPCP